jgi:hypothetical protein
MTMTDLHDLLAETAEGEPPTSMSAESLFRTGRRERRFNLMASTGAVIAAVVATVVGVTAVLGAGPALDPAGPTQPDPNLPRARWLVMSADKQHQYASLPSPCRERVYKDPTCELPVMGSDDGGKTWTRRSTDHWISSAPQVLDNDTLFSYAIPYPFTAGPGSYPVVSRDGARTWKNILFAAKPVEAVADGGVAWLCVRQNESWPCAVGAIDVRNGSMAPLTHQPDIEIISHVETSAATGTVWAFGMTGDTAYVATSHDRGRTWKKTKVQQGDCEVFTTNHGIVGAVSGRTATVLCAQTHLSSTSIVISPDTAPVPTDVRVYRTTDDGETFQETGLPQPLPFPAGAASVWMLANGTVVATPARSKTIIIGDEQAASKPDDTLYVLRPGAHTWEKVALRGVSGHIATVELLPDGSYLADEDQTATATLQRSTDLKTWIDVAIPT